ncbi:MAG: hypothetical protein RLQ12_07765 [Cyclobacteriaceae bacterium]
MKYRLFILHLLLLSGCGWNYDECLNPECASSRIYSFNLMDSNGTDMIFDGSTYQLDDVMLKDTLGNAYSIAEVRFGAAMPKALVVEFDEQHHNYLLYLKSSFIDSLKVDFYATVEKCCRDSTYWVESVKYSNINSYPFRDTGAEYLVVE